jgi:glyoxylase I family protein
MPQPQGEELAKVRARREELRERYLRPQADRPPTTVGGVHHLALICQDTEETIKFYQEFLGFPLVELVENRDYAGSNHFFFDIGNHNLLGFFDFPGHEHPPWQETIGGVQHLAISVSAEQFEPARSWTRPGSTTSARIAARMTASTSATRTASAWSCTGRTSAGSRAISFSTELLLILGCCSAGAVTGSSGGSPGAAPTRSGRSRRPCCPPGRSAGRHLV